MTYQIHSYDNDNILTAFFDNESEHAQITVSDYFNDSIILDVLVPIGDLERMVALLKEDGERDG